MTITGDLGRSVLLHLRFDHHVGTESMLQIDDHERRISIAESVPMDSHTCCCRQIHVDQTVIEHHVVESCGSEFIPVGKC